MMNSLHEGEQAEAVIRQTAEEFMQGCIDTSGLSREQAVELWNRVGSFTGFSFCKSHSASYAQLSFQCTYLKAYYPAQFLAAVISNQHGFYTKDVYLNEARRWASAFSPSASTNRTTATTGSTTGSAPVSCTFEISRKRASTVSFTNAIRTVISVTSPISFAASISDVKRQKS